MRISLCGWSCLLLSLLQWSGCTREQSYVVPSTLEIFPHDEGHTRIMYVEDTTFTTAGINAPQTVNFFQRERLGGTETDLMGREVRLVSVEISPTLPDSVYDFTPDRVWTQFFDPADEGTYFAERIEQNQRVQLLKFPVFPGISWNGNLYNNQGAQTFAYRDIDSTVTVRGRSYSNCVVVIQAADTVGQIFDRFAYEVYAPGIGLIKRYDRSLVFDQPGQDPFNPSASYIHTEELVEWK